MNRERQVLLVLGMHRSGTSALAGILAKRGAALPGTLMEGAADNPRGYFESRPIMEFHDELLKSAGTHWNDWRSFDLGWYDAPAAARFRERAKQLLDEEFGDSRLFVFKDPRVCRFVHFWLDIFRDEEIAVKPVLAVRSPLEVALSLRVRERFSVAEGLFVWLRHTLDAEVATRDMPRAIVPYHAVLADWRAQLDLVARHTGVRWPDLAPATERDIENFLTNELRHQNRSIEGSRLHSAMHAWMTSAYEAYGALAEDPASRSACATLDRIRTGFDEATELFGRLYLHHVDGELYSLRADHRRSTNEVQRLGVERQSALDEATNLRATLEVERQRAIDEALALHATLETERKRALDERATLEAERKRALDERATLETERQRALDEVLALRAMLETERKRALNERATLEAEKQRALDDERATLVVERELHVRSLAAERQTLSETRTELDALREALEAARRDLDHVRNQLSSMEMSTAWRVTQPLRRLLAHYPTLRRLGRQVLGVSRSK